MIIPIEMKMVQSINQKRVGNLSWEAPLECEKEILSQVHCLSSDVVKSLRQVFESEYVRQFIEIYEKARESIEMEERFWKMQPRIKEKISIIGQYGWTALPGALFESYLDCPTNTQQETDDFFMSQLDDNTVQNLLSEIEVITDEPDDVSEAIFDYKNERYKSSAMILFSLIDAILIKSNENEFRERKDVPRKWGNTFYLDKEKGVRFHQCH